MEIDLRKANRLFHDYESNQYDQKWGIIYDRDSSMRVKSKFEKALGFPFPRVDKLLDVGCGTGYASLNLFLMDGLAGELHACDISDGMVEKYSENASTLGLEVHAKRSELENLDYADNSFDIVIGHAVLHHIPNVEKALSEIYRVLTPGGICLLIGEPTRMGDRLGKVARGLANITVRFSRLLGFRLGGKRISLKPREISVENSGTGLEYENMVDVHTFEPAEICHIAESTGFCRVSYESEELLSSFVGWVTRTVENILSEDNLSYRFRLWSYNTYLKLSSLDERLYSYLPSSWFYNMLLFARKPK